MYSKRFEDLSNIYVIDDTVTKFRGGMPELISKEEINEAILNCDNIIIQTQRYLNIYCRQDKYELFKIEVNRIISNRYIDKDFTKNITFHVNGVSINAYSLLNED